MGSERHLGKLKQGLKTKNGELEFIKGPTCVLPLPTEGGILVKIRFSVSELATIRLSLAQERSYMPSLQTQGVRTHAKRVGL
ncbi:hypothetical protein O181_037995 [Austropuccinia psidii MF-1]|uniref:Uncharacterized protein n=1 Tax=Austropuccinia psidii MF-1 TaxID=1389203 RepID=A0A9Q3HDQ1_9BASI|nr:hypothetical protein [Austropuccinia psidii MF-1]